MNDPKQREEAIFEAALPLPTEQRAAYLDAACADSPELRQAVEALLRAHEQTNGPLEVPAFTFRDTIPVSVPPAERVGDRIGRYRLFQQIGEGGCGVVYMAEQEEPVRRRVALKVIKLGMETKQVIARFDAERQALAMMDHPNIAKVLDAGATKAGRPYFVMELVRGTKITDFCDEQRLVALERLKLVAQVCHAIQHAHQKGIIHRDIKPSNILVTVNDGVPVPKVIDFGIAKATQGRLTDQTLFTAFEQFIGTPAYMSPEQATVTSVDIDTRSDIYSLGVLLYELLTGKTPFEANELLEAGLEVMRRTIREKEPPRPSNRLGTMVRGELTTTAQRRDTDPPKLIHLVRGDLDWIVMKCLEKDRVRRYQTANDLAQDIQRHIKSEPVLARPPSRLYRFRKIAARNKLTFAALSIVIVAMVIGLVASNWLLLKVKREAKKSQRVAGLLKEIFKSVTPAVAKGQDTALLRRTLDRTASQMEADLARDPAVLADLKTTLGAAYLDLGEYRRAETNLASAVAIRRRILPSSLELAESLDSLAVAVFGQGRLKEAEQYERESLALRSQPHRNNQDATTSLNNLGVFLQEQGRLEEAQKCLEDALEILRALPMKDPRRVAESLDVLSSVLWKRNHLKKAEELDRQALAIYETLVPDGLDPDLARTLNNLGTILLDENDFAGAVEVNRRAFQIQSQLRSYDHQDKAASLYNLAKALSSCGQLEEAEARDRELVGMWTRLHGPEDRLVAMTLDNLGTVLVAEGKPDLAEPEHRRALELRRKLRDPDVPLTLNNLANALIGEKKNVEAEQTLGETIADLKQAGTKGELLANCLRTHAALLIRLEKLDEAENEIRDCMALCDTDTTLQDSWRKFDAASILGGVLVLRTNLDGAEPLLLVGHQGLHQRAAKIPAPARIYLHQTFERLVRLYEVWGKTGPAAEWRDKLAHFEEAQGPTPKTGDGR